MIEVELPDGSIAEFPDGTTPDVIEGALQQQFMPESQQSQGLRAELSGMTQNPAYAKYQALPGWQKPIVAASDIGQLTAKGAMNMVGLSPEKLAAGVRAPFTGNSYEDEFSEQQRMTNAAKKRAGWAGTGAEIAGGAGAATGLARQGLTLMGRGATMAPGAQGVIARTGALGIEGMGYGGANAYANDQNILEGSLYGLAGGAGGNLISEGATALLSKAAGAFNKKPAKITVDELKGQGRAAFKAAEAEGVMFNKAGTDKLKQSVIDDMTARAFDPGNEPGVVPVLKRLQSMGDNVTFEGLKSLRTLASNGYRPGMKSNNSAVGEIINRIDELVNAADPATIAMGRDPAKAAILLQKARGEWGKARRLETVEGLVKKGEIIGGSQKNQDITSATSRQLRTILLNEAKQRGFSQAELKAAEKAVGSTPGMRALDVVGGLLPQGRLGGMLHGGFGATNAMTGNIPGFAIQGAGLLAGYGAQKGRAALGRKAVEEFTDLVGRGGILAPTAKNAFQRLTESKRDAIARGLLSTALYHSREKAPSKQ